MGWRFWATEKPIPSAGGDGQKEKDVSIIDSLQIPESGASRGTWEEFEGGLPPLEERYRDSKGGSR